MAIMNPFSTRKKEEKPNDETNIESSLSTNNDEENNVNTEKTLNNNLSTPVEKKATSLPTSPFNPTPQNDKVFSELFEESDNEEDELHNAKQLEGFGESYLKSDEDPIIQMIGRNIKDLRKKYPTGGIKASRYITTEVLLQASPTYFDKYLKEAANGVLYVRNKIAENGTSEAIKEAQDHPTDDTLQDKAFYTVHSLAAEFMQKSMWREEHRSIVLALICNEIVGFSRLEPLWRDKKIDEIICNGPKDVQIEIKGELFKVPGCYFDDRKQLSDLISRLYGAIGKTVAITNPTVKGRLHDKSRMFVVHESIAPDGPNFNIRRHPEAFWTPNDLVQRESSSEEMMAYIGNLIYKGASGVVIGGTHSGKTSLLNALTGFYKPKVRLVTLEDNIEMKPNPKKYLAAAMECRQPAVDRPSDRGIDMRTLVHSSMQLRPDVIIVGEVTDDAAFDLCQALNTGHAGASTIHANSSAQAIPRIAGLIAQGGLATLEGSLELISSAFDFIVATKHFPVDGSRRIVSVDEIATQPTEENGRLVLKTKPLWKFIDQGLDENKKVKGYWEQVSDISEERKEAKLLDIEKDLTWEELKELSSIPEQENKPNVQ